MFVENDPHQADARRLRDRGRLRIAADRLRAARDQIDTQLRRRASRFERLGEMEQSVGLAAMSATPRSSRFQR